MINNIMQNWKPDSIPQTKPHLPQFKRKIKKGIFELKATP